MERRKTIKRFGRAIIFSLVLILALSVSIKSSVNEVSAAEDENSRIIDLSDWKTYQSLKYFFEIKYPKDWVGPTIKNAGNDSKWEIRYQFRKSSSSEDGFDVIVYNLQKIGTIIDTDEFPAIKSEELRQEAACRSLGKYMVKNADYPAIRLYVNNNDKCYNPAFFYTLASKDFIFNIVPILKNEEKMAISSEKEIVEDLPEFIIASATFNLIAVNKVKNVLVAAKITAPKPKAETARNSKGQRVCAKENDHPHKSRKNKGKHMDMECCLDPDEYPNPWCHY